MDFERFKLPKLEQKRPIIIAGPCSAETEEQIAALPSHIDQFVFEGEPVL